VSSFLSRAVRQSAALRGHQEQAHFRCLVILARSQVRIRNAQRLARSSPPGIMRFLNSRQSPRML
jgi:hypothetical protein